MVPPFWKKNITIHLSFFPTVFFLVFFLYSSLFCILVQFHTFALPIDKLRLSFLSPVIVRLLSATSWRLLQRWPTLWSPLISQFRKINGKLYKFIGSVEDNGEKEKKEIEEKKEKVSIKWINTLIRDKIQMKNMKKLCKSKRVSLVFVIH